MIDEILTEQDYHRALLRISVLMDAQPHEPEMVELKRLVALVEAFEDEHFPMVGPTPACAARFRAEQEEAV